MYNATLECSTLIGRLMRTTAKAMRDVQMKEDAAKRRANKATNMGIRDKLIQHGLVRDSNRLDRVSKGALK
jgi:hypothetical protein